MRRSRAGFTLVEVLVAVGVVALALPILFELLVGGLRMAIVGTSAARGPESGILLMDRVERDLIQCLQIPGDPRPPVRIGEGGARLELAVPDPERTGLEVVAGRRIVWGLDGDRPTRNGRALGPVRVKALEFRLLEPDEAELRRGWFVSVHAVFPAEHRLGRDYPLTRLVRLPQPSSNHTWYPLYAEILRPGQVRLEGAGAPGAGP